MCLFGPKSKCFKERGSVAKCSLLVAPIVAVVLVVAKVLAKVLLVAVAAPVVTLLVHQAMATRRKYNVVFACRFLIVYLRFVRAPQRKPRKQPLERRQVWVPSTNPEGTLLYRAHQAEAFLWGQTSTKFDPTSPFTFQPWVMIQPWLWSRIRGELSYNGLKWIEPKSYYYYIHHYLLDRAKVYHSPFEFKQAVFAPNPVVTRAQENANLLAPTLLNISSTKRAVKVLSTDKATLLLYLPQALHGIWNSDTPIHPDCNWNTLNQIVMAALDDLALSYHPDSGEHFNSFHIEKFQRN